MSTILYIKANAKPEGVSRTYKVSESFIKAYKEKNSHDEITTLDLYKENIKFLSADDINQVFGEKTAESRNHPVLKYAYQFAEADKYVIAAPLWNLGIPAILKAYIDYISVVGITFRYTEQGAVGLLQGKRAVNIVARGGDYCNEPMCQYEMGDRYLRTIFGFFGITDFTTVSADNLDVIGQDVGAIVNKAILNAQEFAGKF